LSSKSQRKATAAHRRRVAARGIVRVEVQALEPDADLIREVATVLRGEPQRARAVRRALRDALTGMEAGTAFDVFGSELPDETFTGVFDQPRQGGWREVDL
jgi:hypothetical protein